MVPKQAAVYLDFLMLLLHVILVLSWCGWLNFCN